MQPYSQCSRPASIGHVRLGEGRTKVIAPLMPRHELDISAFEPDFPRTVFQHSSEQALKDPLPDICEWRVDYYDDAPDVYAYSHTAALLQARVTPPILATFRTLESGGEKELDLREYARLLYALASSGSIAGIDLEWDRHTRDEEILHNVHRAGVPVILSHHNFAYTDSPEEILILLHRMEDAGADVVKYACMPHNPGDVVRLFEATAKAREELEVPIITMAMDVTGIASRIVGGAFGSAATFAHAGLASAPGQVPYTELMPVLEALSRWGM